MASKSLVIDANILITAVLGKRVREVIETYCEVATFFVPEAAYCEAEEHLSGLVIKRGGDPERALLFLRSLKELVEGRFWPPHWRLAIQSDPVCAHYAPLMKAYASYTITSGEGVEHPARITRRSQEF